MDNKRTGALIAALRKERNLSQAELAQRLYVTDKAVSRWETGRGMPSLDTLEPLAEVLGVSVSELLSGRRLSPEELPKAAGEQLVASMKKNVRNIWKGVLAALLAVALAVGVWALWHYAGSVDPDDRTALARLVGAEMDTSHLDGFPSRRYDPATLQAAAVADKGDYLAVLCMDDKGEGCLGVFTRDSLFPDRWHLMGGSCGYTAGGMGSYNTGEMGNALIVCYGIGLPPEAAGYTFHNSGVTYLCPIEDGCVLDVFVIPDTGNINGTPVLLDENQEPLDPGYSLPLG